MESSNYFFGLPDSNTTYAPSYVDTDGLNIDEVIAISISACFGALVLFLICCCCCSAGFASWVDTVINSSSNGDDVYAERALRRMREEEEKKKEDPSVRREKLLASFDRNKVSIVITQDSYVQKKDVKEIHDQELDPTETSESTLSKTHHSTSDDENEAESNKITVSTVLDDMESNEPKEIYLNSTRKCKLTGREAKVKVANSCAICLCSYDIEDVVVWSSNKECTHAFHDECILQWLVKNQNGECPCCRCRFTDLAPPEVKKEKSWSFRGWRMRYNILGQRDAANESDPNVSTRSDIEIV